MRSRREEEFRSFCLTARPSLVRTATFLTGGDRHFAEDLVQITLVRVYVAWSRVRPERGAVAFARRVLTNAFIDERRRPSARLEQSVGEVPDTVAIGDAPARIDELQRALMALSPGMRAAVVLRHIEGLSVAETADALRCSEGNVKSQTSRALDQLRAHLAAPPATPVIHASTARSHT